MFRATVDSCCADHVSGLGCETRRGTLAFTALERLVEVAGEVQRIALSATVRPLDAMARFVAGFDAHGTPFLGRRIYVIHNNRMFELGFQGREENLPLFERVAESIGYPAGPCEH